MTLRKRPHFERYKEGFAGSVLRHDLKTRPNTFGPCGQEWYGFACPGGCTDFNAHIPRKGSSLGGVLTCYGCNRRWLVLLDVVGVIAREEEAFIALMVRHSHLVGKSVTAEEAFRLRTEQGVPVEMLDVDDSAEFERLMGAHKDKSRTKKVT